MGLFLGSLFCSIDLCVFFNANTMLFWLLWAYCSSFSKLLLLFGAFCGFIQKTYEKMLKSLIIREMQIKTTMRYHLTPVRLAIINKSTNSKCWHRCGERETSLHCWWECRLVQPLWKAVWRDLKKLKMELPYDPAILLLGIYPKNLK